MAAADGGRVGIELEPGDEHYEVTRRLSDKILTAFNHAYAMGEVEIAEQLRRVLIENENGHGVAEKRDSHDPLGQAERWVAFVEARNQYKWVCQNHPSEPAAVEDALLAMKEAYQRWSDS